MIVYTGSANSADPAENYRMFDGIDDAGVDEDGVMTLEVRYSGKGGGHGRCQTVVLVRLVRVDFCLSLRLLLGCERAHEQRFYQPFYLRAWHVACFPPS